MKAYDTRSPPYGLQWHEPPDSMRPKMNGPVTVLCAGRRMCVPSYGMSPLSDEDRAILDEMVTDAMESALRRGAGQ